MHLSAGLQGANEECFHGIFGRSWESDMNSTSGDPVQDKLENDAFETTPLKRACINDVPWFLLRNPEISRLALLLAETDIVVMTANKLVSQRLET